jgi:hypothetical protein
MKGETSVGRVYPNQRRRDPQPLGRAGETALVALCAALLAVGLAALAGLGIACLVAGGGWVWPHGNNQALRLLGSLASGHPGRGLPPPVRARVPPPVAVYIGVAVAELALFVVIAAGSILFARYYRPGDARAGMATRAEAQQVLGAARLRTGRAVIRPDLHRPHRRGPHQEPGPGPRRCRPDAGGVVNEPTNHRWGGGREGNRT